MSISHANLAANVAGDHELPPRRPIAPLALAALGMSCLAIAAAGVLFGPLEWLVPDFIEHSGIGGRMLVRLGLWGGAFAALLAYLTLLTCPVDGPQRGRLLAWLAWALGVTLLLAWYTVLSGSFFPLTDFDVPIIAVLLLVHLALFAAEAPVAKNVAMFLLLGLGMATLLGLGIQQATQRARTVRMMNTLRQAGLNTAAHDRSRPPREPIPKSKAERYEEFRRIMSHINPNAEIPPLEELSFPEER